MAKNGRTICAISVVILSGSLLLVVMLVGCNLRKSAENIKRKSDAPSSSGATSRKPVTGPINYVALGDSTGVGVGAQNGGYPARLFKRLLAVQPKSQLANFCVSGATTSDVLHSQLDRAVSADPNLVTLGIGINDIGDGIDIEEFARNYEEILSRLTSNTKAAIIVTNIPDISTGPRLPATLRRPYHQLIVEFNQRLEAIASQYGVPVSDIYKITHQELPSHPEYFSADGFHPSDQGYLLWAEQMWPTLAHTLGIDGADKP
ncbi:MAG: SGNH/GDSL hydrolase family protein [Pyrinomonadaceae bacterium]